jgi:transcriptional regulator with XRE-family HTH domain
MLVDRYPQRKRGEQEMKSFYKKIGEKIKRLRINANLSQEELAKLLKINRISLSKIENGEQKISAEELFNMAEIFDTTTDNLLDLKQDIKVILEEKNAPPPKEKEVMRVSVPQKNVDKFKEVLLYILNKVGSKPNIGETVIYKLLYFIDFNFYEKYEEQLIGATYKKNNYGPTPIEFKKIVDQMAGKKELMRVDDKYFQYPQTKYLPLRTPDLRKLQAHELKVIDDVLDKLSDLNASAISKYSHNDVPWLTTDHGKIIDYEKVFYRTSSYSVRSYDEDNVS